MKFEIVKFDKVTSTNDVAIDMIKKGEVDFNNFNYEVADQSWRERDE